MRAKRLQDSLFLFPGVHRLSAVESAGRRGSKDESTMITVTPSAVERIRVLLKENNVADGGLRLGVVGGGCSGLTYKFKFETQSRPADQVFEVNGVTLMVDPKSYEYLDGMTLDYQVSLMEQAFVFQNPNATGSCGCGKSFIV